MKKMLLLACLVISSLGFSASVDESLKNIEVKFQNLLEKENLKKQEFANEKAKLENEVVELRKNLEGKELKLEKLKKDSEVRWHRDSYRDILKKYENYYKNLENTIKEKEEKIAELTKILLTLN